MPSKQPVAKKAAPPVPFAAFVAQRKAAKKRCESCRHNPRASAAMHDALVEADRVGAVPVSRAALLDWAVQHHGYTKSEGALKAHLRNCEGELWARCREPRE